MADIEKVISSLVAPVVVISACGLLCLAFSNRLLGIVSRARQFHKELFDASLARDAATSAGGEAAARRLEARCALLAGQVEQILGRARLLRAAVISLLLTILCMILCSLALGLSRVAPAFSTLSFWAFITGLLILAVGMILEIVEFSRALGPLVEEHETLHPTED